LLRAQLNQYRDRVTSDNEHQVKVEFVAKASPVIKNAMFPIFLHLIFPSILEVTSSRDRRALVSFGLTEKCDLATLVFDAIFNSSVGSSSKPMNLIESQSLSPSLTSSSVSGHAFDMPSMCEQLWFDLGVGTFAMKTFNASHNTYTNLIRDVVSKFSFPLFMRMLRNVTFL
jgi:hypothetical protein